MRTAPTAVRGLGLAATVVALAYSALGSSAQTATYFSSRRLSDAMVNELHTLHRSGAADTVLIAVRTLPGQPWWGLGPTLARFGSATGRPLPPTRDVVCSEAGDARFAAPDRIVVLALRSSCMIEGPSVYTVYATKSHVERSTLRWIRDTVYADLTVLSTSRRIGPPTMRLQ
jgi:hypothetical protein